MRKFEVGFSKPGEPENLITALKAIRAARKHLPILQRRSSFTKIALGA